MGELRTYVTRTEPESGFLFIHRQLSPGIRGLVMKSNLRGVSMCELVSFKKTEGVGLESRTGGATQRSSDDNRQE